MLTDAQIEVLSDLAVTYGLSLPNLLLDAEAGRIVVLAEDWGDACDPGKCATVHKRSEMNRDTLRSTKTLWNQLHDNGGTSSAPTKDLLRTAA